MMTLSVINTIKIHVVRPKRSRDVFSIIRGSNKPIYSQKFYLIKRKLFLCGIMGLDSKQVYLIRGFQNFSKILLEYKTHVVIFFVSQFFCFTNHKIGLAKYVFCVKNGAKNIKYKTA